MFAACAMFASLTSCAGPKYLKKRDLSTVVAGSPVTKTKVLKKPSLVSRITKGKHKGGLLYVYEWDKPKDSIINQMYSYVVVRDDKVEAIYEDPPDKFARDAGAYRTAWAQSEALREHYRSVNAQTARQIAIGVAAGLAGAGAAMAAAGNSYSAPYYPSTPSFSGSRSFIQPAAFAPQTLPSYAVSQPMAFPATSSRPQRAYATLPGTGFRDYSKVGPTGVVEGDRVYATMPGTSFRDYSKVGPTGVVKGDKVYATMPGTSFRDYGRVGPTGVVRD